MVATWPWLFYPHDWRFNMGDFQDHQVRVCCLMWAEYVEKHGEKNGFHMLSFWILPLIGQWLDHSFSRRWQ
jgi:hypothetical protein